MVGGRLSDRNRLIIGAFLSLLVNAFLWRFAAAMTFSQRVIHSKYIEITRVNLPRHELAQSSTPRTSEPSQPPATRQDTPAPPPPAIAPLPPAQPIPVQPQKRLKAKSDPKPAPKERATETAEKSAPAPDSAPAASTDPALSPPGSSTGDEGEKPAFETSYDVPAEAIVQEKPEIPVELRTKDFKTSVRVRVDVEGSGAATPSLRTSSGNEEIDHLVLEALRKWRWKPATRNGEAVSSTRYFKFVFEVK